MTQPETASDIPQEGDVIAGKYRVERVLGIGGMGVVVAARHVRLEERVALKFLLPGLMSSTEAVARFEREARAASKIKSEHVARVTDVGTLESGSPYMVMEYLEGGDLESWLDEHGPLPLDVAVDFLLQACEAIGEAHTLGIVHRDLKPANLFRIERPDGQPLIKVLDFGISKFTQPEGSPQTRMTGTTALLGSPVYMSPEQMQASRGVDARTDIWSLGVILYEFLTGQPPFDAEAVTELVIKIATEEAPRLRTLRSDASALLEEVVARCLEKDRDDRYQTVGELAVALTELAPAHSIRSIERIVGTERRAAESSGVRSMPSKVIVSQDVLVVPPAVRSSPALAISDHATLGEWGAETMTSRGRPRPSGLILAATGALLFVALGLVVVGLWYRRSTTASVVAPELTTAAARPSDPTPVVAPPPSSGAPSAVPWKAAAPVGSAPVVAVSAPLPPPSPPAAPPMPHPATAPVAAPAPPPPPVIAPAPRPAPRTSCNPPYTVNASGEHVYKPECL